VSIRSPLVTLAVICFLPSALIAQTAQSTKTGPTRYEIPGAKEKKDWNIGAFANDVRTKTGANIMVDTGVAGIWIPRADPLKYVTVGGALAWIQSTRLAREAGVRVETSRVGQDTNVVYVLTRFGEGRVGPQGSVRAYSLNDGKELTADEKVKAVKTAVEKRNQVPLPPGTYLESGILFVTGSSEDVNLASQVFGEMTKNQRTATTDLQEQLRRLRSKVDSLERRLNQKQP